MSLQIRQSRAGRERGAAIQMLLFVIAVLFGCGALFFAYQIFDTVRQAVVVLGMPDIGDLPLLVSQPSSAPKPNAPNIAAGERVNVLFLGIDRRPSEKCPCRTDTMMLATLDSKTLSAAVVTIPRDLYVPIPEVGENRINTANFYGEQYKYPGGGPALAKKAVEYNLGRRVHYYVLVDFGGFRRAIDALGGIDIDVPRVIDDPMYPDENFGYKPIHIPAGRVHMNGEVALEYARTRHLDSDFGRSKRQVQVLLAVLERLEAVFLVGLPFGQFFLRRLALGVRNGVIIASGTREELRHSFSSPVVDHPGWQWVYFERGEQRELWGRSIARLGLRTVWPLCGPEVQLASGLGGRDGKEAAGLSDIPANRFPVWRVSDDL